MLIALRGEDVDRAILGLAIENRPSLIIDCANAADPYSLEVEEEALREVYVVNAEAIYRFREALRQAGKNLERLGLKTLVITSVRALFSYNDPLEDKLVLEHCYEIVRDLSKDYLVFVSLDEYSKRVADKIWDTRFQARE